MIRRTATVATMIAALTLSMVGGATASHFSLEGADTDWIVVREGFSSTSLDDGILTTGVNQKGWTQTGLNRSHGIRTPDFDSPVDTVSIDVFLDPAWQSGDVAVSARLMGVAPQPRTWPIIEFTRIDGHEGFRYYESGRDGGDPRGWAAGNTMADLNVGYGEWVTLSITTNRITDSYNYAVNGTPVGGASYYGSGSGGLDHVILQTEFFEDGQHAPLDNANYEIQWRGLDTDRLFDGNDAVADDDIEVNVVPDPDPELKVDIVVDGSTTLEVGETGVYTATVTNHGTARDPDLDDWNLGLEVKSLTSINELTLEFCRDATEDQCFNVDDLDDVELKLVGDVVQVLGNAEDTITPGFSETSHFRASFANEGLFTGTVYVLQGN